MTDAPKPGRPFRAGSPTGDTRVTVRVTPDERATLEERAAEAGVSVAEYVRRMALADDETE